MESTRTGGESKLSGGKDACEEDDTAGSINRDPNEGTGDTIMSS
jgi:hypothetical protein